MARKRQPSTYASQWVQKAEEDYRAALRLMKFRNGPTYNLVCFCAQQCAEKYIKGFLTLAGKKFPPSHQIEHMLLPLCLEVDKSFEFVRELFRRLDSYSVTFRYPGEDAAREEATKAVGAMKRIREFLRPKLSAGMMDDR